METDFRHQCLAKCFFLPILGNLSTPQTSLSLVLVALLIYTTQKKIFRALWDQHFAYFFAHHYHFIHLYPLFVNMFLFGPSTIFFSPFGLLCPLWVPNHAQGKSTYDSQFPIGTSRPGLRCCCVFLVADRPTSKQHQPEVREMGWMSRIRWKDKKNGFRCGCFLFVWVGSFQNNFQRILVPMRSMYGRITFVYHKNQLNVGKQTIYGSYGVRLTITGHEFKKWERKKVFGCHSACANRIKSRHSSEYLMGFQFLWLVFQFLWLVFQFLWLVFQFLWLVFQFLWLVFQFLWLVFQFLWLVFQFLWLVFQFRWLVFKGQTSGIGGAS